MISLDELQQEAANNKMVRFANFLDALRIARMAADMGPGAKSAIGEYLGYSTRTISQLAEMYGLPEELIDLDAKPGMYWAAMQYSDTPVETIRHALREGWTTAGEVKQYLGIANERKPPLLVSEVTVAEVEAGQMVLRSDNIHPEDKYPARARLRLSEAK